MFNVITEDADGSQTYFWFFAGRPLVDDGRITGSNQATLTIMNVQESDEGTYNLIISGGGFQGFCGFSDSAELTIGITVVTIIVISYMLVSSQLL